MSGGHRRGFTLLEIALVLVVIAVITGIGFESYTFSMQGAAISAGADDVNNAFSEARAAAMSQNTPVEVRFYDHALQSGATPVYNAMQLRWYKPDKTTPAVSQVVTLSTWTVFDATSAHSSLIASTQAPTPDATDLNLNADTRAFHFYPDGSTDLAAGTTWCLTVRAATQSDPAKFPTNWACVSVDPATGRAQVFRP